MCKIKRELIDLDEVCENDEEGEEIDDIEEGVEEDYDPADNPDEVEDEDAAIVSEREDDLQQILADLILDLLGDRQCHLCVEDYGLTSDDLTALLEVIEDFLAMHDVYIDHPVIAMGCDGDSAMYPSIYETPDMMS